jgi:micrococcal nuclease
MYDYNATMVRVVDGDTVELDVDLGFYVTHRMRCRIYGIDAPEVRGKEREEGLASKTYLERLCPPGEACIIHSFKGRSFNRWVAQIKLPDIRDTNDEAIDIGEQMVLNGHAVRSS